LGGPCRIAALERSYVREPRRFEQKRHTGAGVLVQSGAVGHDVFAAGKYLKPSFEVAGIAAERAGNPVAGLVLTHVEHGDGVVVHQLLELHHFYSRRLARRVWNGRDLNLLLIYRRHDAFQAGRQDRFVVLKQQRVVVTASLADQRLDALPDADRIARDGRQNLFLADEAPQNQTANMIVIATDPVEGGLRLIAGRLTPEVAPVRRRQMMQEVELIFLELAAMPDLEKIRNQMNVAILRGLAQLEYDKPGVRDDRDGRDHTRHRADYLPMG